MLNRSIVIAGLFLTLAMNAQAENGIMGSAMLSGAGQGLSNMSNALGQASQMYGASMLQQQAAEAQRQRDEQQMQWQRERDQRAMANQQRMLQMRQDPVGGSSPSASPTQRELDINEKLTWEQRVLNAEKQLLDTHQQLLKAQAAKIDQEPDSEGKRVRLLEFSKEVQAYNSRVADYDRRANQFVDLSVSHGWVRKVAAQ